MKTSVWRLTNGWLERFRTDNLFHGRDDRFRLVGWGGVARRTGRQLVADYLKPRTTSYYAVKVYGLAT